MSFTDLSISVKVTEEELQTPLRICFYNETAQDKSEEFKSIENLCVGYSVGTEVRGIYGP